MRPIFIVALAASVLAGGAAHATVVKGTRAEEPVGAASGGVDVPLPKGKVRVQCWQQGQKIIDEGDLSVLSLGLAAQSNAITFRQPGTSDAAASLVTQNRTACLLKNQE